MRARHTPVCHGQFRPYQDFPTMSQFANMDKPGYAPNPYAADRPAAPPKKSRGLAVDPGRRRRDGALVCCGCVGMMWFGVSAAGGVLKGNGFS